MQRYGAAGLQIVRNMRPPCSPGSSCIPSSCPWHAAVNVLRHLINPLISWVVQHDESEVLSTEVVQSLVADVFQNPEKGALPMPAACLPLLPLLMACICSRPACISPVHALPPRLQAAPASKSRWSWCSCAPPSFSMRTRFSRSTARSSYSLDGQSLRKGLGAFACRQQRRRAGG